MMLLISVPSGSAISERETIAIAAFDAASEAYQEEVEAQLIDPDGWIWDNEHHR